jgi:hypothetical protein
MEEEREDATGKVAPGMEVAYKVFFTPNDKAGPRPCRLTRD